MIIMITLLKLAIQSGMHPSEFKATDACKSLLILKYLTNSAVFGRGGNPLPKIIHLLIL
jgi:hypothetical protein